MEAVELVALDGVELEAVVHPPVGGAQAGAVIQVHGVTVDMDEGGMFVRLAEQLAGVGFTVLRFSFRGHGRSGGRSEGTTISGEMLDLQAAVELAHRAYPGELWVVAASFGAVPTVLSLPWLDEQLAGLVLWNPVLDLRHTFLEPELPWGLDNFGPKAQDDLKRNGYLVVDGEFRLGRVLFEEMRHYRPLGHFVASKVPTLVVHGDSDSAVSYEVAKAATETRSSCDLHTVLGSDHGFDTREREDEAISVTVDWLLPRRADDG